jgi:hypothetical protein
VLRRIGSYIGRHHIGLLALFIALSGTAYAAVAKNSVGPKQLKTNAVRGPDALESSFSQVPSAANATNASNANKVDGAGVCSGTVDVPEGPPQPLCSSDPLFVEGRCDVSASLTKGVVILNTSQDGGWFAVEAITITGAAFTTVNDLDMGGSEELSAQDNDASPATQEFAGMWVSMGHPAGSSISGHFSIEANLTGTNQGTCRFSIGAIAG